MDNLLIGLFFGFVCGVIGGLWVGQDVTLNEIEKDCLYGSTLEFDDKVFMCRYMPNTSIVRDGWKNPQKNRIGLPETTSEETK